MFHTYRLPRISRKLIAEFPWNFTHLLFMLLSSSQQNFKFGIFAWAIFSAHRILLLILLLIMKKIHFHKNYTYELIETAYIDDFKCFQLNLLITGAVYFFKFSSQLVILIIQTRHLFCTYWRLARKPNERFTSKFAWG